ncbi:MAG TPA: arabinose transporter [Xanthobacteraceae bacterium]
MDKNENKEPSRLRSTVRQGRSVAALLPIMAVVFVAYLVIGLAMPVLPLHVHQGLGLSTFVVGLVAGSQFAASLLSRLWAGHHADRRGAKHTVVTGLLVAVAAGLLYLLSLRFVDKPETSVAILLLGRALLGGAESFIITGALSFGLALMGPQNTGKVMAWVGTALYAAFAVGAPAGSALYTSHGFVAIALAATLIPLAALPLIAPLRAVAPLPHRSAALTEVAGAVWVPGLGLALSGVGFGAIITFIALLFAQRGWGAAWLAFTALSVAFIVGRVVFGHLPDRIGGAKVALACVLIEAVGQALIWLAPWSALALAGVTLTGLGYSLVYPGFGVEAVRRAPPQSRGLALGAYTACLDLSLGLASPALGLIAGRASLSGVYLVSALVVLSAAFIAMRLHAPSRLPPVQPAAGAHGATSFSRIDRLRQQEVEKERSCCDDRVALSDRFIGSRERDEGRAKIQADA